MIRMKGDIDPFESEEDILDKEIRSHKLGREVYIIRSLSDEVEISKNARDIIMTFFVTSINCEKSLERVQRLKDFWKQEHNLIQY